MLGQFAELDQFYPGSRERRKSLPASRPPAVEEDLLGKPIVLVLRGVDTEFFTIGQVARAINRRPGTLRKWEDQGILPQSGYRKPSPDPRGERRLYSRPQAEGIVRLAKECGVMDADSRRPLHDFCDKVWALFNELKGSA